MTDQLRQEPAFPADEVHYMFPKELLEKCPELREAEAVPSRSIGLTKREWFAGMAMMGMLSGRKLVGEDAFEVVAQAAYCQADAMLEAGK